MAGANNAQMKRAGWKARDITKARAEHPRLSEATMRAAGFKQRGSLRARAARSAPSHTAAVATALKKLEAENHPIRLVWTPDLVRSLSSRMSVPEVHKALFEARSKGLLELRAESGVGRVPVADKPLMPRNSDGDMLSNILLYSAAERKARRPKR